MRIKATFRVRRPGQPVCQVEDFSLAPGRALFLHNVAITAEQFGPVSLALARHSRNGEYSSSVSDEPTSGQTFAKVRAGGLRLQRPSGRSLQGFSARKLPRARCRCAYPPLLWSWPVAPRSLVAPGTPVVAQQNRRWVDPHWLRGNSYRRIGWPWVKTALARGWESVATRHLSGTAGPRPQSRGGFVTHSCPNATFTQTICYGSTSFCQSTSTTQCMGIQHGCLTFTMAQQLLHGVHIIVGQPFIAGQL